MSNNFPTITSAVFENKCRQKGLVLDSNMLLLYIVGLVNDGDISKNSRLKDKYTSEDYLIVKWLVEVSKDRKVYVSPQAIAEVLYFCGLDPRRGGPSERPTGFVMENLLATVISVLSEADESIYTPTPIICMENDPWRIEKHGIPDLSFAKRIKEKDLAFLSDDTELVAYFYGLDICAKTLTDY